MKTVKGPWEITIILEKFWPRNAVLPFKVTKISHASKFQPFLEKATSIPQ